MGEILRPHGIRGEVVVAPHTDDPQRLARLRAVWVAGPGGGGRRRMAVERVSWRGTGSAVVLRLGGVADREAAEALRGARIEIPGSQVQALPRGRYYLFELVGLAVRTEEGRLLGRVTEVLQSGANDVFVVRPEGGRGPEILIPAVREVVRRVDPPRGEMEVRLLPGLLPEAPEGNAD